MKAQITYSELSALIKERAGKEINFDYAGDGSVSVGIPATFAGISAPSVILKVESFLNDRLTVSYQVGKSREESGFGNFFLRGAQSVAMKAASGIIEKATRDYPFIETAGDGRIRVDLRKIDQLQKTLDVIDIKGLDLSDDGASVSFSMKAD